MKTAYGAELLFLLPLGDDWLALNFENIAVAKEKKTSFQGNFS